MINNKNIAMQLATTNTSFEDVLTVGSLEIHTQFYMGSELQVVANTPVGTFRKYYSKGISLDTIIEDIAKTIPTDNF